MKLRTLGSAATAIALAAGLGMANVGTADAGTADLGTAHASASTRAYYWMSAHTYTFVSWSPDAGDSCLDDSNNGDGTDNLRAFTCNGMAWQKWKVTEYANGWAQLMNLATGRCLDYSNDGNHFGLRTYECNGPSFNSGFQQWAMVNRYTAAGAYESVLKSGRWEEDNTDMCLDVSNVGTRGYPCNGPSQDSGYQGWTVLDQT
ncbi:hypothetical protein P3T27_005620 [Kitasatospora sp. MAA19]|uniref:RICIN domain-containing protein n=1 Tax=Kitasatospora sp. MAA19 TaxID=3035090 RepID=UPI0024760A4D|nr:RICIN domain-containing protein [Kitasatospora sp. MAA19]MDH6708874.1 hypothetical protein [Kitasatospora sp. MAA19]